MHFGQIWPMTALSIAIESNTRTTADENTHANQLSQHMNARAYFIPTFLFIAPHSIPKRSNELRWNKLHSSRMQISHWKINCVDLVFRLRFYFLFLFSCVMFVLIFLFFFFSFSFKICSQDSLIRLTDQQNDETLCEQLCIVGE